MNFDKWFNNQSRLVQVILLLIPGLNWVVEVLVRLSVYLRTKETTHLVAFLVFLVFGEFWILGVLDLVHLLVKGHLFLAE